MSTPTLDPRRPLHGPFRQVLPPPQAAKPKPPPEKARPGQPFRDKS